MTADLHFELGSNTVVEVGALVGVPYDDWSEPAVLGDHCRVRMGTIIYADCAIGSGTQSGIGALVREHTRIGARCVIGSHTIIDGHVDVGDEVILQGGVYIPTHVTIGSRVFVGPHAVLTNDRFPLRRRAGYEPLGPTIEDDVSIGANATLLPEIRVGRGAVVAAGAVVTRDVPEWSLAVGVPARIVDLPEKLREPNVMRRRP